MELSEPSLREASDANVGERCAGRGGAAMLL